MPIPRSAFAPLLPVVFLGLVFAACTGDSLDHGAPDEEVLASQSQLADVASIVPPSPIATADIFAVPAATMVALRSRHTASLLANGQVLAAGGTDGTAALASVELFTPATGLWTSAAAMAQAREQQAAVVLADGKVLVTGGLGAGGALAGVEIYDPQTTLWTPGAPMAQARARHTITRLSSGKVLVLGGTDGAGALTSGELYEPAADAWTAIAPLHQARARHTTALLPDGRVLVVGGLDDLGGPLASIEILSAAKGTWSFGAPMATARQRHTATLLSSGDLLVAGGVGASGLLASVELYSPSTNLWTTTASMLQSRADHTALITPLGHLVVAGGQGTSGLLATAEAYERVAKTLDSYGKYSANPWFSLGSMSTARAAHTVTLLGNGMALHAGGAAISTSELFQDTTGGLGTTCSQNAQCSSGFCANSVCCATACSAECTASDATGTCVNLLGACYGGYTTYNSGPAGNCNYGGCMLSAHAVNHCGTLGGLICGDRNGSSFGIGCSTYSSPNGVLPPWQYPAGQSCGMIGPPGPCNCVGGSLQSIGNAAPLGHPCATTAECGADLCVDGYCAPACAGAPCWSPEPHFMLARIEHTTTLLPSGKLLFAGGKDTLQVGFYGADTSVLKDGDVFDPVTSTWTASIMAASHYGHTATLLSSGQVLVLGGATEGTNAGIYVQVPGKLNERYTPASNSWASIGPLLVGREYHTSTLLPSGQVLVLGGTGKDANFVDSPLSAAELYAPTTGTSVISAPMPISRSHHTATLLADGKVLVIGGTSSTEVDIYDPATDAWLPAAPLPAARSLHTATTLNNGKILVTGGALGQPSTSALIYDPLVDTWTPAAAMQGARAGHAATLVSNGDVIVAGGGAGAERYDPITDTWAPFGAMLVPSRHGNTTTLLPDGRLVVAFGLTAINGVWATVNLELTSTLPAPLGQPCATSATCNGAVCVDGVCCNTSCAAGACDACTVALGATADGTCTSLTGAPCDDGNGCTIGETCQSGVCGGSPAICPAPDLCHAAGSCNAQTHQCSPASAKPCASADECNASTCSLATGMCDGPLSPFPDGTVCSAGTCQSGVCTPIGTTASSSATSSSAGVGGGSSAASTSAGVGGSSAMASSSAGVGGSSSTTASATASASNSASASSSAGVGGGSASSTTSASSGVTSSSSVGVGGGSASSSSAAGSTAGAGGGSAASSSGAATASSSVTTGAGGNSPSTTGSVTSATASSGDGGAPSATVTASSGGVGGTPIVGSGGCAVRPDRTPASTGGWLALGIVALAAGRRRWQRRR
jgi:MYXO-CTERM domain-containing protein